MNRKQSCNGTFIICLTSLLIFSCGYDSERYSMKNGYDTGSYRCNLVLLNPSNISLNERAVSYANGSSLDCEIGISVMRFIFYDAYNTQLIMAKWECSEHKGLVEGIPVGRDRTVVITAEDEKGSVLLRGEERNITIAAGVITKGGQIKMRPIDSEEDLDKDGFSKKIDCDDTDPAVHPGALEVPDNDIDENCNGQKEKTWYRDSDLDGYGNPLITMISETQPDGYVSEGKDCNDENVDINPAEAEIPDNGVDENCDDQDVSIWYPDSDLDNFGDIFTPVISAIPPTGYVHDGTDCDDGNPNIHPGKTEIPFNEIDENCDGIILHEPFTNSLGMTFNSIPAGTFMMGSPESEPGRLTEETLHQVTLTRGFYIQTTELTQGQWISVMGSNPSRVTNCGNDCPVEMVSWNDVHEFLERMNSRGDGKYSLPTEAQWEYAARAGTETPFSFGQCLSTDDANYDGNYPLMDCPAGDYRQTIVPVASFTPNGWGLYDMHGNVAEWCQDWYDTYYHPSGSVTDPIGLSSFTQTHVIRGGAYYVGAAYCRSACRYSGRSDERNSTLGFRLVLHPDQQMP